MKKPRGRKPKTDPMVRFNASFEIDSTTGCHQWTRGTFKSGHGYFYDGEKMVTAHRWYFEKVNDVILPIDVFCCHKCDNPGCVNLDHIFLGSTQDNRADCMSKGRQAKGEKMGPAKLTEVQVVAIKDALAAGHSLPDIAKYFKVTRSAIHSIRTGLSWSHVPNPEGMYTGYIGTNGEKSRTNKLSEKDVIDIRNSDAPTGELSKKYGVCKQNIRDIRNGKIWKHI